MNNKWFFLIPIALIIVGAIAYSSANSPNKTPTQAQEGKTLVIYSGRKDALILPIVKEFEKKTGIKTTVKSGSSQELGNLLMKEGANSPADIYLTTDASWLEKVDKAGLLTQVTSANVGKVPATYRDTENHWTGVSGRARVLLANTSLPEEQRPTSIMALTQPEWKDKAGMAMLSNESVVTQLSALRIAKGDEYVKEFLQGLKNNNVKMLGGHTDVRKAVGRGEFPIGFTNHYYGHLQQAETNNIAIIYPDQEDIGTFVNVAGVGVVKGSDNEEAAQQFVDYVLSAEGQKLFAELNYEFPLVEGIKSEKTKNLGEFKQMDVSLHETADKLDSTLEMIKQAGF